ncbi:hypothetical protein Tco_0668348 [Tanacetum coccineum]
MCLHFNQSHDYDLDQDHPIRDKFVEITTCQFKQDDSLLSDLKCDELNQFDRLKSLGTSRTTIWQIDYKLKVVMEGQKDEDQTVNSQPQARLPTAAHSLFPSIRHGPWGKTAFLNDPLKEEVYVARRKGSLIQIIPKKSTFKESFVGLKQAPSAVTCTVDLECPDGGDGILLDFRSTSPQKLDVKETKLHCNVSQPEAESGVICSCAQVVRLGINPKIQPEPEDLPKDNPKLEIAVLSLRSTKPKHALNRVRARGSIKISLGHISISYIVEHHHVSQLLSRVLRNIIVIFASTSEVILL